MTSCGATVRLATWRDIEQLCALDAELFRDDAWSEGSWWAEFAARPRRYYVVAEDAGDIVGYAGLDRSGTTADVMTVAVVPQARGRGLGRQLMHCLINEARDGGAEAVLLEVRADNQGALALYEAMGFQQLSVRRRYYQPGDVDAVILRLLLTSTMEAS